MHDTHGRSIAKAITWRLTASLTTATVTFVLTGDFMLSIGVGSIAGLIKLFLYYIHERVWNRVRWGKTRQRAV
ncbi:MAG: DUF2061 domain-containing protein [archaeon]